MLDMLNPLSAFGRFCFASARSGFKWPAVFQQGQLHHHSTAISCIEKPGGLCSMSAGLKQ